MRLFVRRRSFGIQARLTMLAVATALPLVALASFAVLRMVDDQRTQIQQDVIAGESKICLRTSTARSARSRRSSRCSQYHQACMTATSRL